MPTIHAYRRSAAFSVDLNDKVFKFEPNADGLIVCDVTHAPSAKRLIEIAEGYRELVKPGKEPPAPSPYILTMEDGNGQEVEVDLRTLNTAQLVEFCTENEITCNPQWPDQQIRDAIVAFFKV
jgi:hypothetical protein